ncbi:hypothetical protein [Polyangium jinanense]|uniref:Uncharacterized protein n=2 Tax=Polyangium jinanense TaxID=2829994 RepID=A0A9X3X4Q8_9BACT|nr:hypothetical protein [Polyangium jinanense]MDC3984237.1 hypothetical protein [Polyangium jinanense]
MVYRARTFATFTVIAGLTGTSAVVAQEDPCAAPVKPYNGFWGGGQVQVSKRVAGIPVLATARFSYREIRYSTCGGGRAVLPPGVGQASVMVGIPLFNNRRGGWVLQMAAQGQGSQKAGDPVRGTITGAPATAGHINLWETPLPLIQLTGAVSAAIVPQSPDIPLSFAYLGGVRVYPLHGRHTQANLGMTIGGSNAAVMLVPSLAFRVSDLAIWGYKVAIGFEFRSPIELASAPTPFRWRLWGALTFLLDEMNDGRDDRFHGAHDASPRFDLVRSPAEAAPPTQTPWEMTL